MKRILIAGADSYIGSRLDAWLDRTRFHCDTVDMRGDAWRSFGFSGYDAVVLVAGIAHQKETDQNRPLYDQVNHRLAAEAGAKAKLEGVKQFVFLSSMSVYGMDVGRIGMDTPTRPATAYGYSKLAAEIALNALADDAFHVAILRPPMIYGPGCKGNYPRLSRLVRTLHGLPSVRNERSMLYIDTFCAVLESLLESGNGGLYFPQNSAYVSTDELVCAIGKAHCIPMFCPRGLGWLLRALSKRGGTIGKVFGTLTYDHAMSADCMPDNELTFAQSIFETEAVQ